MVRCKKTLLQGPKHGGMRCEERDRPGQRRKFAKRSKYETDSHEYNSSIILTDIIQACPA